MRLKVIQPSRLRVSERKLTTYFRLKLLLIMKNQYIVIKVPIKLKLEDIVATIRMARLHLCDRMFDGSTR